jgi:hypothetical protein
MEDSPGKDSKDNDEVQIVKIVYANPSPNDTDEDYDALEARHDVLASEFEARLDAENVWSQQMKVMWSAKESTEKAAGEKVTVDMYNDRKRAATESDDPRGPIAQKLFQPRTASLHTLAAKFAETECKMDEAPTDAKLAVKVTSSYGQVQALGFEVLAIKKSLDEVHRKLDDNGKLLATVVKALTEKDAALCGEPK